MPRKAKKKVWGPIQLERRSKRNPQDDIPMLERAQALKRKNILEEPKGINHRLQISSQNLSNIASKVGLEVENDQDNDKSCVDIILEGNDRRDVNFTETVVLYIVIGK